MDKAMIAANRAKYQPLAEKWADFYGLPRWAVVAQVGQESRWDPGAMSDASGKGLMQITPITFDEIREKIMIVEGFNFLDVFDPDQNIHAGCWYMRHLLNRAANCGLFPEHQWYVMALAAYNAGPTAVFEKFKGMPPFHETQEYVRLITAQNPGSMEC